MKKRKGIRPQVFTIGKGYTRERALEVVRNKKPRDFRGFTYDPKTGKATLV